MEEGCLGSRNTAEDNYRSGRLDQSSRKCQNQCSWFPGTPAKPIAPEPPPIYPGNHETGLGYPFLSMFGGGSSVIRQGIGDCLESNRAIHDSNFPLPGEPDVISHGAAPESWKSGNSFLAAGGLGGMSFIGQMVAATAKATASAGEIGNPSIPSGLPSCSLSQLPTDQDPRLVSDKDGIEKETMLRLGPSVPCRPSYDLNSLPGATADSDSSGIISSIAPATPDKRKASEVQNLLSSDQANETVCDELQQLIADSRKLVDPSPGELSNIDLNKTPQQQKPRRRKHRPKVVIEGARKRTPKPKILNPTGSKETPTGKRKYVRRNTQNKSSTTPPTEETTTGIMDTKRAELTGKKSCRRSLNFDLDNLPQDTCARSNEGNSTAEVLIEAKEAATGLAYGQTTDAHLGRIKQDSIGTNIQTTLRSRYDSNCSTHMSAAGDAHARGLKRQRSSTPSQEQPQEFLPILNTNGMFFPEIYKKKRTEKSTCPIKSGMLFSVNRAKMPMGQAKSCHENDYRANPPISENSCWISGFQLNTSVAHPTAHKDTSCKMPLVQCITIPSLPEKSTKKRTKGHTRVRDPASLIWGPFFPDKPPLATYGSSNTCLKTPIAEPMAMLVKKKRARKVKFVVNRHKEIDAINAHQPFFSKSKDSPQPLQKSPSFIDSLADRLKQLDINNQNAHPDRYAVVPYHMENQEPKALVLYRGDGSIVPFEGPIRKRRPRPKVDIDEETNRVWQLLMGSINSEGIDGADLQKAKWWEEERRVFQGRADSFIARMRLVQGDRRFSQWKGSVLDSVIGVFLTQNVSDHLSSSAFMSLAARFPLKSRSSNMQCIDGSDIVVTEQCLGMVDPNDTIQWNEKTSNQPVSQNKEALSCNEFSQSYSGVLNLPKDSKYIASDFCESSVVVHSKSILSSDQVRETKTAFTGEGRPIDDEILSPNSVVSSQNSTDPCINLTGERIGSCSESNSEADDLTTMTCMELLHMAGISSFYGFHNLGNGNMNMPTTNTPGDVDNLQDLSIFHFSNKKHGISVGESSGLLTAECTSQATAKKMTTMAQSDDMGRSEITLSDTKHIPNKDFFFATSDPKQNGKSQHNPETLEITESTSVLHCQKNSENSIAGSNIRAHAVSTDRSIAEMKSSTSSSKGFRDHKAQAKACDWDKLRREAEAANGRRRDQTAGTMDSLDWDAVRLAEVDEIADTIKERGMNHVLAGRIKALLDRLVADHGSIDLEWLRDVPPDKAKEYLLSIRGLGLKSVECVRLLTLHHLAFPVDTNVGRIAVRLGWVPLQPLPESLQLHLLELYPVLESIQKYLWPRLCKLAQGTLYELHYQMITFGKVFCTKSKPNCNACPMRGECRHFASAFASARLALPGPEEKGLVCTDLVIAEAHGTDDIRNPSLLLLPQSNQLTESKPEKNICNPIIEEPASPEPESTHEAVIDIEDTLREDPNEIPMIKLDIEEFTTNLQNYMQNNMELQEAEMSKALVALTPEAASIPMPKLKNVNRLRTEHYVYELPDEHYLLHGLDKRERDDPCSYLLAIWAPGETANSIEMPERRCDLQEDGTLCNLETCFSCNSKREAESQFVRGTLLIPCRTAMRGSFPLNGTYFQVNEVFADHDSSLNPIDVPRSLLWNLQRRTVYFGTSIPTIFKGLSTEGIQHCFWRGYVCVRGFDQKTRAPRPLMARLHFPASKLKKTEQR